MTRCDEIWRAGDRSRCDGCLSAGIQCFGGRSVSCSSSTACCVTCGSATLSCAVFAVLSMTSSFYAWLIYSTNIPLSYTTVDALA